MSRWMMILLCICRTISASCSSLPSLSSTSLQLRLVLSIARSVGQTWFSPHSKLHDSSLVEFTTMAPVSPKSQTSIWYLLNSSSKRHHTSLLRFNCLLPIVSMEQQRLDYSVFSRTLGIIARTSSCHHHPAEVTISKISLYSVRRNKL
jgi:hypothetical protein